MARYAIHGTAMLPPRTKIVFRPRKIWKKINSCAARTSRGPVEPLVATKKGNACDLATESIVASAIGRSSGKLSKKASPFAQK